MQIIRTGRRAPRALVTLVAVGTVALAGLVAPTAGAASATMTITATGFVPRDVAIGVGEQVTFANTDKDPRQLEIKPTTGVTCIGSLVVAPSTGTVVCTFASAGNFTVTDPNTKGNTFRGTVAVTAAPTATGSVTLAASKSVVVYGAKVTLSGKVSPAKGGVSVDLLARPYPEAAFAKVATVSAGGDGSYTFALPPQLRTEYKAQFTDGAVKGESPVLTVQVRPRVALTVRSVRGSTATLRTAVVSTISYAGKPVLVQRRNSQGGWTTVKTIRLGTFSSRVFSVKAPGGTSRWRVYLQASQSGGGYLPGFSPTRLVRR